MKRFGLILLLMVMTTLARPVRSEAGVFAFSGISGIGLAEIAQPYAEWIAPAAALLMLASVIGLLVMYRRAQQSFRERLRAEQALHDSEAKYRIVADNTYDWEFWQNQDGEVLYTSPSCGRITGRPAKDFCADPDLFLRIVHPEDQECYAAHVAGCHGKEEAGDLEFRIVRPDGTVRWIDHVCQPVFDRSGKFLGRRGSNRDTTDRKQAEAALVKLNQELERRIQERTTDLQAKGDELKRNQSALMNIIEDMNEKTVALEAVNKELEAFSYSVSHDLRSPLRSIDGFSRALLEDYADKLDDEGKENLRTVRAASQRMGHIIDDMLRLAQLNRGEMRVAEVNLSEMVGRIAAGLREAEPERVAEFIIVPDCIVVGDAALLRIAMENIIGNAWKYTGKKPSAKIEFGMTLGNPNKRVFFVRDNGCGFEMKFVGKLFGAFQRLHSADEFPGTGIGLASVQRVMRRHGGKVWIEADLGIGTTLYFTLPRSQQRCP